MVTAKAVYRKQHCKVSGREQNVSRCEQRGHQQCIPTAKIDYKKDWKNERFTESTFNNMSSLSEIPSRRQSKNKKTKGIGGAMAKDWIAYKSKGIKFPRLKDTQAFTIKT
tara:strand:- start:133 stop:462 length:330 start_codon:yes stop_codon:yes gene_type:complete